MSILNRFIKRHTCVIKLDPFYLRYSYKVHILATNIFYLKKIMVDHELKKGKLVTAFSRLIWEHERNMRT